MSEVKRVGSPGGSATELLLMTYDANGRRHSVRVGDPVSVCVRRVLTRQMHWYPGTVDGIEEGCAWVRLKSHPEERFLRDARGIRVRR